MELSKQQVRTLLEEQVALELQRYTTYAQEAQALCMLANARRWRERAAALLWVTGNYI